MAAALSALPCVRGHSQGSRHRVRFLPTESAFLFFQPQRFPFVLQVLFCVAPPFSLSPRALFSSWTSPDPLSPDPHLYSFDSPSVPSPPFHRLRGCSQCVLCRFPSSWRWRSSPRGPQSSPKTAPLDASPCRASWGPSPPSPCTDMAQTRAVSGAAQCGHVAHPGFSALPGPPPSEALPGRPWPRKGRGT